MWVFLPMKYAACCMVLSAWALVQLLFMGILFHIRSLAFAEDMHLHKFTEIKDLLANADDKFAVYSMNCFVAMGFYAVFLLVSIYQFIANSRLTV